VVAVADDQGRILNEDLLAQAQVIHRQLRPQLPEDYVGRMKQVFAGGARMAVARVGPTIVGLAVFRLLEKTYSGRELYCDDLVTDEARRSTGVGHALMAFMEGVARERRCDVLALDSGTHRHQAHKFYFREQLSVTAFHFSRKL
jgi:GNAT superfamily N-acetyltransferase